MLAWRYASLNTEEHSPHTYCLPEVLSVSSLGSILLSHIPAYLLSFFQSCSPATRGFLCLSPDKEPQIHSGYHPSPTEKESLMVAERREMQE